MAFCSSKRPWDYQIYFYLSTLRAAPARGFENAPMDDGQRWQYEQPYEQQREREACLLREEEDRQRQETRRREEEQRYRIEADADRRHWENEEGLRQREQAWRGLKSLWKRLGLDPKTGLPRERQR